MPRQQTDASRKTWTKTGRIIFSIWLAFAIVLFVVSAFDIRSAIATGQKSDADIILFYGMFVMTFPAAYIGFAFAFLYSLFFVQVRPTSVLDLFVFWAAFVAVGYVQWFILAPWAFKKLFRRKQLPVG